jgi:hypothetical protein
MGYLTGSPVGSRAGTNRYTISPAYIIKNEPAVGAGVRIKVNSELLKIRLGFPAIISLDGSDSFNRPGVYVIKRSVETVHIRLGSNDGGAAIADAKFKVGTCMIETCMVDIPTPEINPDLLPSATFAYTSLSFGAGVTTGAAFILNSAWVPMNSTFINNDQSLPHMIFVKYISTWRESAAAAPPGPAQFIWKLTLYKSDDGAQEVDYMLWQGSGSSFGITWPVKDLCIPVRSLWQPYAAENINTRWVWNISAAVLNDAATALIGATYLK